MRRISLFAIAATTAFSILALGADVQRASAAPAAFNWSGWYVGLNAGGNWGYSDGSTSAFCSGAGGSCYVASYFAAINALGSYSSLDTSGFTGGIHGGYNWQSGALVAGIELDFEYLGSEGSRTLSAAAPIAPNTISISQSVKADWLFTVRPRVGMATGGWLWYGTGGLAVSNLKASWTYFDTTGPYTESASVSATKAGWIAGGGVEAALPGKLSFGIEYLYLKFGSVSATGLLGPPATAPLSNVFNHSADLASSIVRVRLNKLF
jgi:outer membrane immunogenic protein